MAGMDITPEREKQVLFTAHTMTTLPCLWVSKANTSVDQLKGKKVGVQNGTTHQKFIMDKHRKSPPFRMTATRTQNWICKMVVSTAYLVTPQW